MLVHMFGVLLLFELALCNLFPIPRLASEDLQTIQDCVTCDLDKRDGGHESGQHGYPASTRTSTKVVTTVWVWDWASNSNGNQPSSYAATSTSTIVVVETVTAFESPSLATTTICSSWPMTIVSDGSTGTTWTAATWTVTWTSGVATQRPTSTLITSVPVVIVTAGGGTATTWRPTTISVTSSVQDSTQGAESSTIPSSSDNSSTRQPTSEQDGVASKSSASAQSSTEVTSQAQASTTTSADSLASSPVTSPSASTSTSPSTTQASTSDASNTADTDTSASRTASSATSTSLRSTSPTTTSPMASSELGTLSTSTSASSVVASGAAASSTSASSTPTSTSTSSSSSSSSTSLSNSQSGSDTSASGSAGSSSPVQTSPATSSATVQSSCTYASESVIPQTINYTSIGSDTTSVTQFVTTVDPCADITLPIAPPPSMSTVDSSASCAFDVRPWCITDNALESSTACLCPVCILGQYSLCDEAKPTDTSSCQTDAWVCSVTVDPDLSSPAHSLPPGGAWITAPPDTSTSTPWWAYTSTLHATSGTSTSSAPFNATLSYSTVTESDGDTVIHPYRAWHCVAGPVCFPPDFDFVHFDFDCLFKKGILGIFNWQTCVAQLIFGIFPKPKIPFPPPIGPPDLDYQLALTTVPVDGSTPRTGPAPGPGPGPPPGPPPAPPGPGPAPSPSLAPPGPDPTGPSNQPSNSPSDSPSASASSSASEQSSESSSSSTETSSSSSSSSSSSESCTESTETWSVCSTICSTVTSSASSTTESCTSICATLSGCSGTDSSTTTTVSACSIRPYWDDPAIESSLSSLLSQFPFSFDDTMLPTSTVKTSTSTSETFTPVVSQTSGFTVNPSTSTTSSSSTSTTSTSPAPTSTTSTRPSYTSTSSTSRSSASTSSSKPSSSAAAPATSTPKPSASSTQISWPARTEACYAFEDGPDKVHNNDVYCNYQESVEVGGTSDPFSWESIAGHDDKIVDSTIGHVCQSLKERKVVITSNPDHKPWGSKSPAECYNHYGSTGKPFHAVALRVARDSKGCRGDGTDKGCTDDYCKKDLKFEEYSPEQCRAHFASAIKDRCYGKGFGDKTVSDSTVNIYGGSFWTDCMMWTVIAGGPGLVPNITSEQ